MKRSTRWTWLVFFGAFLMTALPSAWGAPPATPDLASQEVAGYLENVSFEKLPGKERVILAVSKQSGVTIENLPGGAIAVRLENLFVPEELRRPLSDQGLTNVVRVTPAQKAAGGRSWGLATIELKQKVPYSVRQEGMNVLIDFNISSLALAPAVDKPQPTALPAAPRPAATTPAVAKANGGEKSTYTGSRIFLDVQDADIKAVLRLLAEQGKVSIVSGDDVKGPVTLHMKDVPWDQALDTLLNLKGLAMRREGSIITVVTLDRKKKDEADRVGAEEAQRKAEDERKTRQQKENVEQGNLKKIAIEAKIVEVTTNFSRDLGINWAAGYQGNVGGVDYGLGFGNSGTGTVTPIGSGIGLTGSSVAVNFPAAATATPALGLVLGTSKLILDAKLSALEASGDGKVISSPKVTTLENEKATIWQGKRIPVVTPATTTSPATVRYEDADLRLIVTPKITYDQDRISMEIDATNKDVDSSLSVLGNPAINTSGVTSKIVVRDGDTIVVGGVYKTIETFNMTGVPLLSKIPVLGWLFKYETKSLDTREILIFITPRIIKDVI
ncbi:MAG: secretin and TonB N-terminal domain-containing protein [Deltaproteobacteria bacterium]|nr:secretin and TonB N-terminal domain-containing protein [Deltaproteobacteria bacterium]